MENITHHNNPNLQITLRDRFLHLTVSMVGQKVVLTQTNGAVIEGLFCTFTPFASQPPSTRNIYVIKACRLIKPPTAPDAQLTSLKDGETVMIPADKVSNVLVKSMRLDAVTGSNNGNTTPTTTIASGATNAASATASAAGAASTKGGGDMFQTDGDIASAKHGARSGDLIAAGSAWTSPVVASSSTNSRADALLGGLEDNKTINGPSRSSGIANSNSKPSSATTATPTTATTAGTTTIGSSTAGGLRGNIGEWDQFKANEELFNVSATFDENLYTTELDKSLIDAKRIAEAERIAREIEQTTSSNIHVAEERGHAVQTDYDEEDRFSGVLPTTTGAARSRKEKSNHAPSALPVTNSRASALLKGTTTTTADGPKKTAPPPVKKMNYAAAVAAQADSKKSVAAAGVASSGARVTPERSTPSDAAASRTLEEKASLEADKVTVDEERMSHVPAMETTPHTSDEQVEQHLAEEVANLVMDDRVAEEKTVEHATDDTAVQHQNATSAEEQPPMEDGSEPKATDSAAEAAAKKLSSKLNANAKEFTFNPTAKTFTPSFPTSVQIPAIPDPAHFVDPNTGMPMGHAMPPQMHGVHYMPPGHMSQHGTWRNCPVCSCWLGTYLQPSSCCCCCYRNDANDEPAIPISIPTAVSYHGPIYAPHASTTASTNATSPSAASGGRATQWNSIVRLRIGIRGRCHESTAAAATTTTTRPHGPTTSAAHASNPTATTARTTSSSTANAKSTNAHAISCSTARSWVLHTGNAHATTRPWRRPTNVWLPSPVYGAATNANGTWWRALSSHVSHATRNAAEYANASTLLSRTTRSSDALSSQCLYGRWWPHDGGR